MAVQKVCISQRYCKEIADKGRLNRQQRTVRSAYHFTNMLWYRGFLLHDFMNRLPNVPVVPSQLGQKCRDAAISMAD